MPTTSTPAPSDLLQQAIRIDPNYEDAYLSIAGIYGRTKELPARDRQL